MNPHPSIISEYYPHLYSNISNPLMSHSHSPLSTQASDDSSNRNTPITPAPVSNDNDMKQESSSSNSLNDDNAFRGMFQVNFQFPNIAPLVSAAYFNQHYPHYPQFPPQSIAEEQENQSPSVSPSPSLEMKKEKIRRRRVRTIFKSNQLEKLEASYAENPLPTNTRLKELCGETGLTDKVVSTWFKNKRAAARKPLKQQ